MTYVYVQYLYMYNCMYSFIAKTEQEEGGNYSYDVNYVYSEEH